MKKKVSEWLAEIEDAEIRKKAIANFKASSSIDCEESNMWHAIFGAFTWEDTPEGYDYWMAIRDSYHNS